MNDKSRLDALSTFLKAKRAQIKPESIGLLLEHGEGHQGYEEKRFHN